VTVVYDLLTTTGQTLNSLKSSGAALSSDNEAAVKEFQASVSTHANPTSSMCFGSISANDLSVSSRASLRSPSPPQL